MVTTVSRISTADKKAEGIKRMEAMKFNRSAIRSFKNKYRRTVFSDYEDKKSKLAYDRSLFVKVKNFERENHALVYAIIRSHTDFGLIDNLLFVSDYIEDWEMERANIRDYIPLVYAINHDHPEFSEFGSISIIVNEDGDPVRLF